MNCINKVKSHHYANSSFYKTFYLREQFIGGKFSDRMASNAFFTLVHVRLSQTEVEILVANA